MLKFSFVLLFSIYYFKFVHSSHKHICVNVRSIAAATAATCNNIISFHFVFNFTNGLINYQNANKQNQQYTVTIQYTIHILAHTHTHTVYTSFHFVCTLGAPFFHFVCFSQRNWNGTFAIPQQMYCVHKLQQINLKMSRKGREIEREWTFRTAKK